MNSVVLLLSMLALTFGCGFGLLMTFHAFGWHTDTSAFIAGNIGSFFGMLLLGYLDKS